MQTIIYTNGEHPDFVFLCRQLDDNLNQICGKEKQEEYYNQYNTLKNIHDVWIAYEDNIPVGCAAFKQYEKKVAEVKRVYVRPQYRGKGISKELMKALEEKALENGFNTLILETGKLLHAAIHLYLKTGYSIIENYGQYKDIPESICLQKNLNQHAI